MENLSCAFIESAQHPPRGDVYMCVWFNNEKFSIVSLARDVQAQRWLESRTEAEQQNGKCLKNKDDDEMQCK